MQSSLTKRLMPGQDGAALITVLSVLICLTIIVALLMQSSRRGVNPWARESARAQAGLIAESGIAYQLYLERFSDSAEPDFGKPDSLTAPAAGLSATAPAADSFLFRLDSSLAVPEVRVNRARAFLEITSVGRYRGEEDTLVARFGKALDDSVFGAALTLENGIPLEPIRSEQVIGPIRLKTPSPGIASFPWYGGFSVVTYAAEFMDKKYNRLESLLEKKLAEEKGESGNGNFTPSHPPGSEKDTAMRFPSGGVELVNDGRTVWNVTGPLQIFSKADIRVRGLIHLNNVELYSGQNITFEDSVSGGQITLYARGSIFIHDRCQVEMDAVAVKDIILRDHSRAESGSVLLSVGKASQPAKVDSLNAIRLVNQATAEGFLIAGGANGRVVVGTAENRVDGVVLAPSVWLGGEVNGPVVAQRMICDAAGIRNCLGPGRIDRRKLPAGFVQPLQLGPGNRKSAVFKLLDWRRK